MQNINSVLIDGGFVILHEITSNFDTLIDFHEITRGVLCNVSCDTAPTYCLTCAEWEEVIQEAGFELIQRMSDGALSTLFLCRKRKQEATDSNAIIISGSGEDFNWVEDDRNELRYIQGQDYSSRIWLISENN